MNYSCIDFKINVGNYDYEDASHPHAVSEVENMENKIPSAPLTTKYNEWGKIETIEDEGKHLRLDFTYGPDGERWSSTLLKNGKPVQTTLYANNYEKVIRGDSVREYYYLDKGVMVIRENNAFKSYLTFTDNLGSILAVMDKKGEKVFEASYDAWGKQTITQNDIGLYRGYTGHEMLNEYDIINMNGRLYDPVIGRFFSPDNYVQMPDNSQNFNRYSYCLNNPLKYTDPSGNFWHLIIGAAIGGIINWVSHGAHFNAKGLGYFSVGAVAGAIGAGIGSGISSALPIAGHVSGGFAAGFWGTAGATTATSSFVSGALIGGGAGFAGGAASGVGNAMLESKNLLTSGVKGAIFGGFSGALVGGVIGGIDARIHGRRFFDGAKVTKIYSAKTDVVPVRQIGNNNCIPASAENVDKTLGGYQNQTDWRGYAGGDPNIDPIEDLKFWPKIFVEHTGYEVQGKGPGLGQLNDIVPTLNNGGSVVVQLDGVGKIYHSVVVKDVFVKVVEKINGSVVQTGMYNVMDPATGSFRYILPKDITGNIWFIKR